MIVVSNADFINAIFGPDAPWCHVTGFSFDPSDIPCDKHLIAWKGDYFCRYTLQNNTNQYFTISTFYCDEQQQARRRKALYRQTHCIVLDDVREKLAMSEVEKLPPPSWILETSPGSEQWGYILTEPCTDRLKVENLLDGLIANGLAPDGKDPGMRGVTRYVRLPEGINNKASKLVGGVPFKCQMLLWQPFNSVTMEQLATPFCVDLTAERRETRVDGAATVADHPLLSVPDLISIKEVRSEGRFDITCPWVDEHTGGDDSGSAVFTNADGSIGFKCHHGNCQNKTGYDLLNYIESHAPGFRAAFKNWQVLRDISSVTDAPQQAPVSFLDPAPPVSFAAPPLPAPTGTADAPADALQVLCDDLRRQLPASSGQRDLAARLLKITDDLPKIEQKQWHDIVIDELRLTKAEFKEILADLRQQWYGGKISTAQFYDDVIFVKELNQFYNRKSRIFFSTEAFQNAFSHEDPEARKVALQDGRVRKVDRLDYAPKMPVIFEERGCVLGNTWCEDSQSMGSPGDISRWHDHFAALGWQDHKKHIEQWMAFTLRHPDRKINHILLLGSGEGCGKDFLLYPLAKAMGDNYQVVDGEELLDKFNDYVLATKYLHINEAELGDRREALAVSNKMKPLAAAPPETLNVNQKGLKRMKIRKILNVSMTTNSVMPLRLNGPSRRFYAVWSDINPRDKSDQMRPEWLEYWRDRWPWMRNGGWEAVAHHLYNVVDLSDFNPDQAPPMTDFLREIKESSKSPMLQTIETFIDKRFGAFSCDLLTARDMGDTLRAGVFSAADLQVDAKYFTDKKIGMVLKDSHGYHQVRCRDARIWILRDEDKYLAMPLTELQREYERQIAELRGKTPLTAVS